MPKVYNKRDPNTPKDAVYVGRPTKWGNIFSHLPNTTAIYKVVSRDEAVDKYRQLLMTNDVFWDVKRAEIRLELKGKDLVCWCAPKSCHADVLLEIANEKQAPKHGPFPTCQTCGFPIDSGGFCKTSCPGGDAEMSPCTCNKCSGRVKNESE